MSTNDKNKKIVSMQDYWAAAQLSESDEFIRYVIEGDAIDNEGGFLEQMNGAPDRVSLSSSSSAVHAAPEFGLGFGNESGEAAQCRQVLSEIGELKSQLSSLAEMVSALSDAISALQKPAGTKRRKGGSATIFSDHEDEGLFREIAALYARHLPHLSQPRESSWLSGASSLHKALKVRIKELLKDKEYHCQSPEDVAKWFEALFIRVSKSDFLSGRKTDFKANIHWLLKPTNLQKVLDGSYDNTQSGSSSSLAGVYSPAASVAASQAQVRDSRLEELERMQLPDEVKAFVKMQIEVGDSSPLPQLVDFAREVVSHG
ncbi:hypothetical protein D6779_02205 [Candidatus Parcubacteria bacterium]|nr:MAG: hypothetical protein D6779_02205 [Candidatus Parcubacteria bacterium]